MINKIIIFSFLAIALLGCGDDKDNAHSKYAGVWYDSENDNFIEILNNGDLVSYKCSLNGYTKIDLEGYSSKVVGDNVIWNYRGESGIAALDIQGDMLISSEEGEEPISMEKFDSIPDTCEGNAIEISYISTTEVNEGEDTTFTIDFNYRLADPTAVINVYFSGEDDSLIISGQDSFEVSQIVIGSGSVTVNHVPVILENAAPYYLYIFINPTGSSGENSPSAYDRRLLTIHPNQLEADADMPSQVTGLWQHTGGTSATSIQFEWSDATDEDGIDHYNIYREGELVGSPTISKFKDIQLQQSTTYSYEVAAVDTLGYEGPRSAPFAATTKASENGNPTSWTIIRDFNSGTLGDVAMGSDAFSTDAWKAYYSNEFVYEGSQSAKLTTRAGQTEWAFGGVVVFPEPITKGGEIWVSFNIYVPSDFDTTSESGLLKFIRFTDITPEVVKAGHLDLLWKNDNFQYPSLFRLAKEAKDDEILTSVEVGNKMQMDIQRDTWQQVEMYVKFDDKTGSMGGDGQVRVWLNNVLLIDTTEMITLRGEKNSSGAFYFSTYWNGGAPKDQSMWLDNLILTTERPSNTDINGFPYIGKLK